MSKKFCSLTKIEKPNYQVEKITDDILAEINSLKINGPTREFKAEELHVRSMLCIGESPTSKMSIHPESEINGKEVKVLSRIASLMPGAPMLEGHQQGGIPWARIFKAEVVEAEGEKAVKASYYFLAGVEKYETIAKEIDAGIRSEGSISYSFREARCSICHEKMSVYSFLGMSGVNSKCGHDVGKEYELDGKKSICYWYPEPESIGYFYELSHVFRGAYPKTKTVKNSADIDAIKVEYGEKAEGVALLDAHVELWRNGGNGAWKYCVCNDCGYHEDHTAGTQCGNKKCPDCGKALIGSNELPKKKEGKPDNNAISELVKKLYGPVKPLKSVKINNEFFNSDALKSLDKEYNLEPKYDGVWFELHRSGDDVKLYTDSGKEYSDRFPTIVEDAKKVKADNFVFAGEMIKVRSKQRLRHIDVVKFLNSKEPGTDKDFRYKVFDTIVFDNKDVRELPLSERRTFVDNTFNSGNIHKTKVVKASGGSGLPKRVKDIATREGTMIKDTTSKYDTSDSSLLYKWKKAFNVDGKVTAVEKKENGFVYTVEVGQDSKAFEIGKTLKTSLAGKVGDIIQVSVDYIDKSEDGKYNWYNPIVETFREDKKIADPLSTVERIYDESNSSGKIKTAKKSESIMLGDIVPVLLKDVDLSEPVFLCGGLVENGKTTNDVDIIVRNSEFDKDSILKHFPEDLRSRFDIIFDASGPRGASLEITPRSSKLAKKTWKYANKFVLQKHWWGNKAHWDLRFGSPSSERMWGWTLFSKPSKTADSKKVRTIEKEYHDPKWMDVNGEIPIGEPGNPTKNLIAHMDKIDSGDYEFIKRTPDFLEIVLKGEKYKGRYVWRKIKVKASKKDKDTSGNDETKSKNEDIWVMWKPKDQKTSKEGGKVNKIVFKVSGGVTMFWESEEQEDA